MATDWSHLVNAVHIDHVLANLTANPDSWTAAYRDADIIEAAYQSARGTANIIVRSDARIAAWNAARDATNGSMWASWTAAKNAILALIAYDDCAYLLDEKPSDVNILALLGNPAAVLLAPACIALYKPTKEIK
jgi:hypothetical protein